MHKPGPGLRGDRRAFLTTALAAAAAAPVAAQTPPGQPPDPTPTQRSWDAAEPRMYPDPDVVALDPSFRQYIVFNSLIKRSGRRWASDL